MKSKYHLFVLLVFLSYNSILVAAEPSLLEVHVVAESPSTTTKEYVEKQHDGKTTTTLLKSDVLLDGSSLKEAKIEHEEAGYDQLTIVLTDKGAKLLGAITTEYVGKQLGIVIDGQLQCAPKVMTPILGGSLTITGNFTHDELVSLVAKLNQTAKP